MERFEIGNDERLAAIVDAAARDDAVITRSGHPVAEVRAIAFRPATGRSGIDLDGLARLRAEYASLRMSDAGSLVRAMRDADEH